MSYYPAFDCNDCGLYTYNYEYYMVNDSIWDKYGAGTKMLCIKCLEKRIGRELQSTDFKHLPINYMAAREGSDLIKLRLSEFR